MKSTFTFRFILVVCSFCMYSHRAAAQEWAKTLPANAAFSEIQSAFYAYYGTHPVDFNGSEGKDNEEYLQFKRWENFMQGRLDASGHFPNGQLFSEAQRIKHERSMSSASLSNWTFLGPFNVPGNGGGMGRVDAVHFQPGHPDTVWAGGANGGLWKSTDGGMTWNSNTDFLPNLGVADIAIDPVQPNNMYIATGDGFGYVAGGTFWGGTYSSGVLKSVDGGVTWNASGLSFLTSANKIVQRLALIPRHPSVLLAGVTDGLYRTADGGVTWTSVLPNHVYDIKLNTANDSIIYCSSDNSIYKSADLGLTWNLLSNTIGTGGRVSLGVTAANPLVIYALETGGSLYASTDGGVTFNATTNPPGGTVSFYGYYDMALGVSPRNANLVYVGGLQIGQSTDGGNTWNVVGNWQGWPATTYVHADNHRLEFIPGTDTVFSCDDGGLFKSADLGANWTNLSSGIHISQIYRIGGSATVPSLIYSGFQDNGNVRMNVTAWDMVNMADGMENVVDWSNPNNVIITTQYGNMQLSTDGANTFTTVSPSSNGAWTIPVIQDPVQSNTFYAGYEDVYKSIDGGNTWTTISTNLAGGGNLTILVQSKLNRNTFYAGNGGSLWTTSNGGTTWSSNLAITLPLTGNTITAVAVSDVNPLQVWVTLSGYVSGQKVYSSRDGGQTWTNYSGSLPNVPADAITHEDYSNDALYLGTDLGVYFRDSTMADWMPFNTNLPNVIVDELEINYATGKIRAATYGRGLWESPLQDVMSVIEQQKHSLLNVYPNPTNGNLFINGQISVLKKVSVRNLLGQEVLGLYPGQLSFVNNQYAIDLSGLSNGIYFVRLDCEQGTSSEKVILSR